MTRRPEKPHLEWKLVRGVLTPRHRVTWTESGKRRERVLDEKGKDRFQVYCPPRLRAFVASLGKRGAHLLAKNLTEGKGYDSVEKAFRTWRKTLGDAAQEYTLHGLRKLACVELAEGGAGDAEIQAVTGQSAKTVAYYRRLADKKKLSRSAQTKRERNKNET